MLRHDFATQVLVRDNGSIVTLPSLLGHGNINTTTRYLHPGRETSYRDGGGVVRALG